MCGKSDCGVGDPDVFNPEASPGVKAKFDLDPGGLVADKLAAMPGFLKENFFTPSDDDTGVNCRTVGEFFSLNAASDDGSSDVSLKKLSPHGGRKEVLGDMLSLCIVFSVDVQDNCATGDAMHVLDA